MLCSTSRLWLPEKFSGSQEGAFSKAPSCASPLWHFLFDSFFFCAFLPKRKSGCGSLQNIPTAHITNSIRRTAGAKPERRRICAESPKSPREAYFIRRGATFGDKKRKNKENLRRGAGSFLNFLQDSTSFGVFAISPGIPPSEIFIISVFGLRK